MGSSDGIRFHIMATHDMSASWVDELTAKTMDEWNVNRMTALARIHQAFHEADRAVREAKVPNGDGTCDDCHERKPVVILTTGRYCAPCALTRRTPA